MEITYRKRFIKDVQRLPPKIQRQVRQTLDKLREADSLESAGVDYKYMEGQKKDQNYYRIRVGAYRIGVEYVHPSLIVVVIASRGDVYKQFPPK